MGSDAGFRDGHLVYSVSRHAASDGSWAIPLSGWDGGYVAFSGKEYGCDSVLTSKTDFRNLLTRHRPEDGFLVELDLWRAVGTVREEVCVERDDHGFFVQTFWLETAPTPGTANCFFREAETVFRWSKSFKAKEGSSLRSIEVVHPEHRLNIYITAERG